LLIFKRRLDGFTLMEVVLTMALLAIGITSVVKVLGLGVSSDNVIESQLVALRLAQEAMEDVKDATSNAAVDTTAAADSAALASPFDAYTRTVTVSGTPKQVTVTVTWLNKGIESQTISLVTIIADTWS
jgi:prepilin-type N-terminal cleavage/methylation domain-containing protein